MIDKETEVASLCRLHRCHQLGRHPLVQVEAIAMHYVGYAQIALELRKLVELRKHVGPSEDVDNSIEMIAAEIKAGHAKDLGIELSWQNVEERNPVLEWYNWTVAAEVPLGELLLVEIKTLGGGVAYQTAKFGLAGSGGPIANIGGRFHFDVKIIRWASIQHLLPNAKCSREAAATQPTKENQ